jgi:hypothetical protein
MDISMSKKKKSAHPAILIAKLALIMKNALLAKMVRIKL